MNQIIDLIDNRILELSKNKPDMINASRMEELILLKSEILKLSYPNIFDVINDCDDLK